LTNSMSSVRWLSSPTTSGNHKRGDNAGHTPGGTMKSLPYTLALVALGSTIAAPTPALACGGLFCSNSNPVNQVAERIVFSRNDDETVTSIIEIQYEGPAHEF